MTEHPEHEPYLELSPSTPEDTGKKNCIMYGHDLVQKAQETTQLQNYWFFYISNIFTISNFSVNRCAHLSPVALIVVYWNSLLPCLIPFGVSFSQANCFPNLSLLLQFCIFFLIRKFRKYMHLNEQVFVESYTFWFFWCLAITWMNKLTFATSLFFSTAEIL